MPETQTLQVLDLFSGIRSAVSALDLKPQDFTQELFVKSNLIVKRCLESIGRTLQYIQTSRNSTGSNSPEQLTLFAGGSLVKTSARLAAWLELEEKGLDYGKSFIELLAKYDLNTQSWRTSQTSFLDNAELGLAEFSETWPRSGMMRNGIAYRLADLVPIISEIDCGLSLIQTPRKTVSKPSKRFSRKKPCQEEIAESLGEKCNPEYREWMMGFPIGWTDLQHSETPLSHKFLTSSEKQS